jgi:group I intron endonuclease
MKVIKGVYVLTNKINGKRYVGIGCGKKGIEGRWAQYKRYECKQQTKLYNALKLYGVDNFTFEVILETDDIDNAKRSEMFLIDVWNLQDDRYGYNITAGGDSIRLGLKHSEETKQKISNSNKGKCAWFKGKHHTEESKQKLREANLGKKASEETKQKLREAGKGKKMSEENKLKLSERAKNQVVSNETREKLRLANIGKKLSEEHRKKISEGGKGLKRSKETCERISKAQSIIRKIQDTISGEVFEGSFRELSNKLNLNYISFKSNITKKKKYKQYKLL